MVTWEEPPDADMPDVPTREQIAAALSRRAGRWAIVARHDRAARAEAHVQRIVAGREFGAGFEAVHRRVANEHRVYAMRAEA
jgi:hypothetical protein